MQGSKAGRKKKLFSFHLGTNLSLLLLITVFVTVFSTWPPPLNPLFVLQLYLHFLLTIKKNEKRLIDRSLAGH